MVFKKNQMKKSARRSFRKKVVKRRNPNNSVLLKVPGKVFPRSFDVKLGYAKSFTNLSASASSSFTQVFGGNHIVPYTAAGQAGSPTPAAGDELPAMADIYGQMYNEGYIMESSFSARITTSTNITTGVVRFVLVPVPYANNGSDTWTATVTQMNTYTYEQLAQYPGARKVVLAGSAGGPNTRVLSARRTTRVMTGNKDIEDDDALKFTCSDGGLAAANYNNPTVKGFMWFLKEFNTATTASVYDLEVNMILHAKYVSREFNPVQILV